MRKNMNMWGWWTWQISVLSGMTYIASGIEVTHLFSANGLWNSTWWTTTVWDVASRGFGGNFNYHYMGRHN